MIKPGQIYRSCDPRRENNPLRLRIMTVGPHRASVFYLSTGRHGEVLLTQLHATPTTKTGRPRRTGYALETK